MTRINTLAPVLLPTPWLMAEYRELPRIINAAVKGVSLEGMPLAYRMGPGHVKFFYNKLHWLAFRHYHIRLELKHRFPDTVFKISMADTFVQLSRHKPELCRPSIWYPSAADHETCLGRLRERWPGAQVQWTAWLERVVNHHTLPPLEHLQCLSSRS